MKSNLVEVTEENVELNENTPLLDYLNLGKDQI